MRPVRRLAVTTLTLGALGAGALGEPARAATLPVYRVTASPAANAKRLASRLGIGGAGARGLRYYSKTRFATFPTKPRARAAQDPTTDEDGLPVTPGTTVDPSALAKLRAPKAATSTTRFLRTLSDLGLRDAQDSTRSRSDEAITIDAAGKIQDRRKVDRSVAVIPKLSGVPLLGPGAKISASYDGASKLRRVIYNVPALTPVAAELSPSADIDRTARLALEGCTPTAGAKISRRTLYWAPLSPGQTARRIVPHYEYRSSFTTDGEVVASHPLLLPLVADAPHATATATADGSVVRAAVAVTGGRAPYRVRWTACHVPLTLDAAAQPKLEYTAPPTADGAPYAERLLAEVTDADGLLSVARAELQVTPTPAAMAPVARSAVKAHASAAGYDVGLSYIGASQNLPGSAQETAWFKSMADKAGVATRYVLAESAVAPTDWYDPKYGTGGTDKQWADNVDLAWFTGHGSERGWLAYNQKVARYDGGMSLGDGDLEYLTVAACNVLSLFSAGGLSTVDRWGRIFDGLHMMFGYSTVSYTSDWEGYLLGKYLWGLDGGPLRSAESAWSWAAYESQPSSVGYVYLAPVAKSGRTNLGETFKAQSGDIRASDIDRWVVYYGWA